jgi:translocation and assembly module TamB
LKLEGAARAGGQLTLDGELRPIEAGGPEGWVRIRGRAVDAVRLPDTYVQVIPDITLHYAAGQLRTEGGLTIPTADIVVRELPESAVSPSRDAVVRDREAGTEEGGGSRVIGGELAVTLGPNVRLRAFGLDTLLEGTVKVSQGEDGEAKGYGTVRLKEGKFGAYGKELIIERGTLGFAGPLDDPSVDIRATRHVDWEGRSVTAGILMSGTATRPESRVFSEPSMSEADALSYLISGRPMQSANANDRSAIAGAALSLGVQQTSPLTQALGGAIALDELGMQGGTLDETEVVAGKQIGSDLYVRFAYGLFNRIGTVMARYKVGRNVSIEAGRGEEQTLDLIYSVETD